MHILQERQTWQNSGGGCRFDKGGGLQKKLNFYAIKILTFKGSTLSDLKMPTFYEYLRIKKVHFLAILRKAIKNGLLLKIVRKKSLLFKISTQIFLKIRGGFNLPPSKI